jgi:hypothetical protein
MGWYKSINFPEDIYHTVNFLSDEGETFPCHYVPEELRVTSRVIVRYGQKELLS